MTDVSRALTERITRKREQGLLEMKFLISITDESTPEGVAGDVEQFYADIDAAKAVPLDFGDLRWREVELTA